MKALLHSAAACRTGEAVAVDGCSATVQPLVKRR